MKRQVQILAMCSGIVVCVLFMLLIVRNTHSDNGINSSRLISKTSLSSSGRRPDSKEELKGALQENSTRGSIKAETRFPDTTTSELDDMLVADLPLFDISFFYNKMGFDIKPLSSHPDVVNLRVLRQKLRVK